MNDPFVMTALALAGAAVLLPMARQRLELSLAKHPSLTGHSRMAKRVAAWVPGYAYDEARFFGADQAPADVQLKRRAGFMRLAGQLSSRHAKSIALTQAARQHLPDLQLTGSYRVPYPFSPFLRLHLGVGSFVQSSDGVTLTDMDGVRFYDLTGSYGVNVMGHDFYKDCIREGSQRVADLGPLLGSYHPVVAWNVELAPGGAQQYFGVQADMVTYGKTLGGGLPVGVVCGKAEWMKRFREERPADICFARGTFNSHPYVMGAMQVFLERLQTAPVQALYADLDTLWNGRAEQLNSRLKNAGLPVQVANLSSIWTVSYTQPSRYNWMLQFYLREQGLALSWVGTGRLVFSLNYSTADFDAVCQRFVAAAQAMQADGWWWNDAAQTNKSIRRSLLREMLKHR